MLLVEGVLIIILESSAYYNFCCPDAVTGCCFDLVTMGLFLQPHKNVHNGVNDQQTRLASQLQSTHYKQSQTHNI